MNCKCSLGPVVKKLYKAMKWCRMLNQHWKKNLLFWAHVHVQLVPITLTHPLWPKKQLAVNFFVMEVNCKAITWFATIVQFYSALKNSKHSFRVWIDYLLSYLTGCKVRLHMNKVYRLSCLHHWDDTWNWSNHIIFFPLKYNETSH